MRVKRSDLNIFMPPMRQTQMLVEINNALEKADRLDDQIKLWNMKPISNLYTKIVQDELHFLKEGKLD